MLTKIQFLRIWKKILPFIDGLVLSISVSLVLEALARSLYGLWSRWFHLSLSLSLSLWVCFGMSGQALNNGMGKGIKLGREARECTLGRLSEIGWRQKTSHFPNFPKGLFFLDFRLVQLWTKNRALKIWFDQIMDDSTHKSRWQHWEEEVYVRRWSYLDPSRLWVIHQLFRGQSNG
jgi:hypothetical protein